MHNPRAGRGDAAFELLSFLKLQQPFRLRPAERTKHAGPMLAGDCEQARNRLPMTLESVLLNARAWCDCYADAII